MATDRDEAFQQRAHALCTEIATGMARMGVHTSCHFDAGLPLIVREFQRVRDDALEEAARAARALAEESEEQARRPYVSGSTHQRLSAEAGVLCQAERAIRALKGGGGA